MISTFSRKPVWRDGSWFWRVRRGPLRFCVWGQQCSTRNEHVFAPGLFAFGLLHRTDRCILLVSWLGTLWTTRAFNSRRHAFRARFISLFLSGGISGNFLARMISRLRRQTAIWQRPFSSRHGRRATFAILWRIVFWFPTLFGRRRKRLSQTALIGLPSPASYCVFMPMHWLRNDRALKTFRRADPGLVAAAGSRFAPSSPSRFSSPFRQGLFLINFLWSSSRRKARESNPWRANTLEWSVPSPDRRWILGLSNPSCIVEAYGIPRMVPKISCHSTCAGSKVPSPRVWRREKIKRGPGTTAFRTSNSSLKTPAERRPQPRLKAERAVWRRGKKRRRKGGPHRRTALQRNRSRSSFTF